MKNHPHPGRIVRQDFLEPLGLTVTATAKVLGVARQTVNNLVNEKAGISAEMAVRLSKAFGPSPVLVAYADHRRAESPLPTWLADRACEHGFSAFLLDTAVKDGRIKRGDIVVLEAMGGGFTWGAAALRY